MQVTRRGFLVTSAVAPFFGTSLASAEAAKDSLVIAYPFDVPSWDAVAYTIPLAMPVFASVFDQPLTYTPDLKLVPNAVKAWSWVGSDGLALAVELRDDVQFHNGDQLTTADFKFSFQERQAADPKLATAGVWRNIKDIEIQSPTKAVMHFSSPKPTAPPWLAYLGSFILPKAYFEKVGKDGFLQKPVGSGPYTVVEFQQGARIVLEANAKYWKGAPKLKRVTIQTVKDPTARVAAVQSGQADITTQIDIREAQRLSKTPGLAAQITPVTEIFLLQVGNVDAFKDQNVRLAAHHAIDKAALSKAFFGGAALPLSVFAPPKTPGYVEGFKFAHDPKESVALLAKSGFSPQKPVKIHFNTTKGVFPSDYEMAQAIAAMWKKVGIDADLQVIELTQYYELNHSGKMPEATLYRWGNDTGDPEIYTGYILNPKLQFSAWKSDDMGERIGRLFNETDEAKRLEGYREVNKFAVEQGYAMPLLQGVSTVAYHNDVAYKPFANGWIYPPALAKK
ncbi:MAG: ABC transporter substrate-binding protein [Alphaproteobacteria bacterium]|nr:ABC transporter substrate-binding protein [Alphaproteobacteria bacterium]